MAEPTPDGGQQPQHHNHARQHSASPDLYVELNKAGQLSAVCTDVLEQHMSAIRQRAKDMWDTSGRELLNAGHVAWFRGTEPFSYEFVDAPKTPGWPCALCGEVMAAGEHGHRKFCPPCGGAPYRVGS